MGKLTVNLDHCSSGTVTLGLSFGVFFWGGYIYLSIMHAHVHTHAHTKFCLEIRTQLGEVSLAFHREVPEIKQAVFPGLPHCLLRQASNWDLGLPVRPICPTSAPQRPVCLCLPRAGNVHRHALLFFLPDPGIELWSFGLQGRHFTD